MRAAVWGLMLAVLLVGASQSRADFVFALDLDLSVGRGEASHADAFLLRLTTWDSDDSEDRRLGAVVQPSMIGQSIYMTHGDEGFASFTRMLTNGSNDHFMVEMGYLPRSGFGGFIGYEADFLGPATLNGVDLAGYTITRIGFRINSLEIRSRPDSFMVFASTTFEFHFEPQSIPEPASLSLAAVGGTAVCLARRRRNASRAPQG